MLNVKIEILVSFCRCCCCHFSFIQQGAPCLNTFFVCFFFSRLSLLFMLLFGNFRPVFVRKQMPTDWSQPSIDVANVTCNHLSSHDCIRNLPDSLEIVKKKNEEKRKCFKTINSSRLFPVHRIRWLFFGSQFISHSIYHRCWTMFNTLRKVIHSFTLRFHSKLWSMEHRTWLCVCVFWAKIQNFCDKTIHQSWRVAFMPKKSVWLL